MPAKSAVSTKGSNVPETTYQGLRRFNLGMGFLHLLQGILMIVLSNATTYPIYTNFLTFDTAAMKLVPATPMRRRLICDAMPETVWLICLTLVTATLEP